MLTQLATVKARLGLDPADPKMDEQLTAVILGVSARFASECNRNFARDPQARDEFPASQMEIAVSTYPVESIARFEVKRSETEGWVACENLEFLVRSGCVISLASPLGTRRELGRVIYAGGYVLPGDTAAPGQSALPPDLEQAALEQVVFWYQNRDRVGVIREWPKSGVYEQFSDIDLLPSIRAVLQRHTRVGNSL